MYAFFIQKNTTLEWKVAKTIKRFKKNKINRKSGKGHDIHKCVYKWIRNLTKLITLTSSKTVFFFVFVFYIYIDNYFFIYHLNTVVFLKAICFCFLLTKK